MRIVSLAAIATVVITNGANAETTNAQRICLADSSPAAQKLATCSSAIASPPLGEPQVLANLYISRGLVLLAQKQFDRAIADFDQAVKLNAKDAVFRTNRGNAYREKGRFDLALQDYDSAIAIDPTSTDAYFGRALTFQEKARYDFDAFLNEGSFEERAIADYGKLLELRPKSAGAYSNRAVLYQRMRKYELAIVDLAQAIQLNPNNPDFFQNRASAYIMMRKYDLAIADYRKMLTMNIGAGSRKYVETSLNELGAAP